MEDLLFWSVPVICIVVLVLILAPGAKKVFGAFGKMGEHDEMLAWVMENYEKESPEMEAVAEFMLGFDYMTDASAAVLREMIKKVPRRVVGDIQAILYDYKQWKAGE